jgi:D-glycero-beta-D-manno-heptose-7-phosphate kinase
MSAAAPVQAAAAAARARVLVVGDVMLDRYWFGEVHRISPEAPVPVVKVGRTEERLGGAANVARNARSLGAAITLLSVVGDDEPGQTLKRMLEDAGIRALLHADAALHTTIKLRVIGRQQQLLRIDFEESPSEKVLQAKLNDFSARLEDADVVALSDYGKGGMAHIAQMVAACVAAKKPVLVDPKGHDYSRYAGATLITPNRAELKQVIGPWRDEAELTAKAQGLRADLKLKALLLTRSEEGMTLFDDAGVHHHPAQAREVFDVSGAGDTVIATLAALTGGGLALADAVTWANKAGGIVVGKLGTAVVSPKELFE